MDGRDISRGIYEVAGWTWDWVHGWSRNPCPTDQLAQLEARIKALEEALHGKPSDRQDPA